MNKFFTIPPSRAGEERPTGHFYLAQPHPAREDIAGGESASFYSNGGHWISKRRDGKSPSWQIARRENGSVIYKTTGTSDFELACRRLDAFVEQWGPKAPVVQIRPISTVYFVQSETGLIKIGASHDHLQRVKELQAMSPVKLTVLATVQGRYGDERDYHRRFREHRSHGEWFNPHPDILAEIARLKDIPA